MKAREPATRGDPTVSLALRRTPSGARLPTYRHVEDRLGTPTREGSGLCQAPAQSAGYLTVEGRVSTEASMRAAAFMVRRVRAGAIDAIRAQWPLTQGTRARFEAGQRGSGAV